MEYQEMAEILERLADHGSMTGREAEALLAAAGIVREKPCTRTIGEVQGIVDAVRAGLPVQIDYFDAEQEAMGGYEYCSVLIY